MKTCKKCGSVFDGARCPPCQKAYLKQYWETNKERLSKKHNEYKTENLDKIKTYQAEYRKLNAEKAKEYISRYTRERVEQKRLYDKDYRKANEEKIRREKAEWNRAHPEAARASRRARRARVKGATGSVSPDIDKKLFKLQKGKCACCREPLGDDYHLDHIMPLALGGSHSDDNMQLLRAKCNLKKNAKHPVDFMREKGFLI